MAGSANECAQQAQTIGGANAYQVGGNHYRSAIQHWDYVLANGIPYLEAQIIKYLTRWRKKGGHQDLRKTQHVLKKLFESEGLDWNSGEHIETAKRAAELGRCAEQLARDASGGYTDQTGDIAAQYGGSVAPSPTPYYGK